MWVREMVVRVDLRGEEDRGGCWFVGFLTHLEQKNNCMIRCNIE